MAIIKKNNLLEHLKEKGFLSEFDVYFSRFITRLAGEENPELALAAALVCKANAAGHVCLDLGKADEILWSEAEEGIDIDFPPAGKWQKALVKISVVGKPGDFCPLILDGNRLYLQRYRNYESELSSALRARAETDVDGIEAGSISGIVNRISREELDVWQKVAAYTAATKRLAVITGGPGTGKTTTVAKILALLIELAGGKELRIFLTAPTGKAAARMEEAMGREIGRLDCRKETIDALPKRASTIHRLLGVQSGSPHFRYGADNPLPADVVVVDEASMIDLPLMAKLIAAIPLQCRLIIIGDRNQLASVQAGAVLGDICNPAAVASFTGEYCKKVSTVADIEIPSEHTVSGTPQTADAVVGLHKTYRYQESIAGLSSAVLMGEPDKAREIFNREDDLSWKELPPVNELPEKMKDEILQGYREYMEAGSIEGMFAAYNNFKILCALRRGPYGVEQINAMVEHILEAAGFITGKGRSHFYIKQPVMITRNDYTAKLYNGDTGIMMPGSLSSGNLRAFFLSTGGELRSFSPYRLPAHETAYALTIHKSQGSEFDNILMLLPDKESRVLTRELLYTGITRAKKHVSVWSREDIFRKAVSNRIIRASGLEESLWGSAEFVEDY